MSLERYRELTSQYDRFIYESYHVEVVEKRLMLNFKYKIEGEFGKPIHFNHRISYGYVGEKGEMDLSLIKKLDQIVFTIGLIESINYFKTVCPRSFVIRCGRLNKEQKKWWQKLFYHGLGEFIYLNDLTEEVAENTFVTFHDESQWPDDQMRVQLALEGNLIPVGGGKDSVVTLDLMAYMKAQNLPFVMSPPQAALDCIEVAGYTDYLLAKRHFDKKMIQMNDEGFLNGHVPFSAILGFISVLGAALTGKRYIPLSNERSANESTVLGESYNHQYSKSYEFEKDFNDYVQGWLLEDVAYFSLLRPLYEVDIAERFATLTDYHHVFRSCNRGKKTNTWCGVCSKCLFVNIILAPFMTKEALFGIFGHHLLENKELEPILIELLGLTDKKPFECVGTVQEVRWSMKALVAKYEAAGEALPYLAQVFIKRLPLEGIEPLSEDGIEDNIPEVYQSLLGG